MQIEFLINGDEIACTGRSQANTGSANYYFCRFRFSADWEGLECFAAFRAGEESFWTVPITDGECPIPAQAIEATGHIRIGVYGTAGAADGGDFRRIATNWTRPFRIIEGALCEGSAPAEQEADWWEKYVAEVKDVQTALESKADKKTDYGGFAGGDGANVGNSGGAVGYSASANDGGAVGTFAIARDGGAVGYDANAINGGAVGHGASANNGGAVGNFARAGDGFAGGNYAQTVDADNNTIDAVQLGKGTNGNEKTLQVYDYQLLDKDGYIPAERLCNAPRTIVENTLASNSTENALAAAKGKELDEKKADFKNESGGFNAGEGSTTWNESGVAIGYHAGAITGSAVGKLAFTEHGASLGYNAVSAKGGAVGNNAKATTGAAAGDGAEETAGGGAIGDHAYANGGGGAVGNGASAAEGGAIGKNAASSIGGAAGENAISLSGGAVGSYAKAELGGAVGDHAKAGNGFAGGMGAKAVDGQGDGIDAIQLGEGENNSKKTLKVYNYQLMDEFGNIPTGRLANAPRTTVVNDLNSTESGYALSAAQGRVLDEKKADKAQTLAGYGIGDAYTKTEVDAKVSAVYRPKGAVQSPYDLPSWAETGDVYNVLRGDTYSCATDSAYTGTADVHVGVCEYKSDMYNGYILMDNSVPKALPGTNSIVEGVIGGEILTIDVTPGETATKFYFKRNAYPLYDFPLADGEYTIDWDAEHPWVIYSLNLQDGDNVVWVDTYWDVLSGTVDLSGYVQKQAGKSLSSNDYTTGEKGKVANLPDDTNAELDKKADKETSGGGFAGGHNAYADMGGAIGSGANVDNGGGAVGYGASAHDGGAVGNGAKAYYGGAVGYGADTGDGGAVGYDAFAYNGGAVGNGAKAHDGGAVGYVAVAGDGFAGGNYAKTVDADNNPIDAVQLGTGTNSVSKSLQVYDFPLMDADGTIPTERLVKITKNTDTEVSAALVHNEEIRCGEVTALTVTLPEEIPDAYISSVVFTSGETATNLIYPETVKMSGQDCLDGIFVPVPGKRYTVVLSYDGVYVSGIVGGVLI